MEKAICGRDRAFSSSFSLKSLVGKGSGLCGWIGKGREIGQLHLSHS
jgi:hypothetical protein